MLHWLSPKIEMLKLQTTVTKSAFQTWMQIMTIHFDSASSAGCRPLSMNLNQLQRSLLRNTKKNRLQVDSHSILLNDLTLHQNDDIVFSVCFLSGASWNVKRQSHSRHTVDRLVFVPVFAQIPTLLFARSVCFDVCASTDRTMNTTAERIPNKKWPEQKMLIDIAPLL